MRTSRPAATCVVTVDDGPGGVRWALVAVNLDPASDPLAVTRSRLRSPTEVLTVVAQFLADAGLDHRPMA
jgi:hypothetical protein